MAMVRKVELSRLVDSGREDTGCDGQYESDLSLFLVLPNFDDRAETMANVICASCFPGWHVNFISRPMPDVDPTSDKVTWIQ